jgi:V/A-type H+-transporting ATPase subunit E
MTEKERSSGVQELIDRLREQGVEEGNEQAEQLLADARHQAAKLLDQARKEAAETLQHSRKEADRLQAAGEEALCLAGRDAVLALKEEISQRFADQVRRLVSHSLSDEQFVERLILEIAGRAVPQDNNQPLELLLPEEMVPLEQLRRHPEEATEGSLSHFVLALAGDLMRQGVTFGSTTDNSSGITVKMVNDDVEITLDDQAIARLLLRHLLPRFRAMMEGMLQ